jgi:ABC-type uncharacterized transport system involved in gliding motility auxiliary subunit
VDGFNSALKAENYIVKTVDIVTQSSIPADADMIIAASPTRDFLPQETQILDKYFNEGGKGMFFVDPTGKKDEVLPILKGMIKKWGINVNKDEVVEGNNYLVIPPDPRVFLPALQSHDITNKIINQKLSAIIAAPSSMKISEANGYTVKSLLKSSDASWAKVFPIKTLAKEAGDIQGPLDLAAAVSKVVDAKNNKEMRAVVFCSSSLLNNQLIAEPRYGDKDLILNAAAWLKGTPEEITIHPKEMVEGPITITQNQKMITIVLVMIIIPGIVLIIGIVVWMRRRHL